MAACNPAYIGEASPMPIVGPTEVRNALMSWRTPLGAEDLSAPASLMSICGKAGAWQATLTPKMHAGPLISVLVGAAYRPIDRSSKAS